MQYIAYDTVNFASGDTTAHTYSHCYLPALFCHESLLKTFPTANFPFKKKFKLRPYDSSQNKETLRKKSKFILYG